MNNEVNGNLWDSFWAIHASSTDLYHHLLWRVRFLFSSAYARKIAQATGKLESARLLEIGCGSARTLHYLDQIYSKSSCYALDLSSQAIQLVRSINPQFQITIADAFCVPLESNQFDVTFSIGLIEHFTREQAGQIVSEKIRVTQKGGMVTVMVPWISSVYNLIVRKAFGRHWPFGDENPFHRRELEEFLEQLGLSEIKIHVIYGSTLLGIGRK
ncbi:MAG: methyltransferase domain-containing protein [Chloroflexi bacterium]|nr:methyltransferase domain-containing protein [Chloroflexota bacterium]